jgi:peptidoglycan/xylan/chitin deacetylase (PgdA/CDA1 family)
MKQPAYITTSWDDGHPLDARVAELLAKFGLRGTFYVPRTCEYGTMALTELRELSRGFEIGAHTLSHVDLSAAPERQAREEIVGGKAWLEESIGVGCPMFCPPKGKFAPRDLEIVRAAGHAGLRSVELLSIDFPRPSADLLLLPTTVQAYPHGPVAYAKNTIKRRAFTNLGRYLVRSRSSDWARVARTYLDTVLQCGGVFHLWGHSWEIERTSQWQRLEEVLRCLGERTREAPALTNWEVCKIEEQR